MARPVPRRPLERNNLPSTWSPKGENLAWRIPIGGRSAPVVFGNRLYLLTVVGGLADTQERLVALDAESGKMRLGASASAST